MIYLICVVKGQLDHLFSFRAEPIAADGKKLPLSVTFKGVRIPRDLVVPPSVKVYSSRQEESSFPKSGPSLDKASLERYSQGDEDDAIYDCPEIDADDEEMEEEFDKDSEDDDER
ncbi:unnamed protein product [Porites lobata]|uniref:Uncharacterized protein n=1 Tax=Porites lobata TaxID=104759 RepID=A0ABN8QRT2_9CNID|nr:unnamed protein product [Porites lobata]